MTSSSRGRIIVVWWLACVMWSAGWLFLKVGVSDVPPLTFAVSRLAIAFVALAMIVTLRAEWRTIRIADLPLIGLTGVLLLGVNYALTFWGAQFLPSAVTSVLQATSPVFGFAIGAAIGVEHFTAARALALLLGIAGVALVANQPLSASDLVGTGAAAVVAGGGCAALAYALVKQRGLHASPPLLSALQTLAALVPLTVAARVVEGKPAVAAWSMAAIIALLYLALVSSVIAFMLNYWLLQRVPATTVLAMALVQPLIAALLGYLFLGERLGPYAAAGGLCILISATLILAPASGGRFPRVPPQ